MSQDDSSADMNEAFEHVLHQIRKAHKASDIKCPVVASAAARPKGYTDAIHEALKKVAATMPPKAQTPEREALPQGFTPEQWDKAGTGFGTPKPTGTEASSCIHDWKIYRGLNMDDIYCTVCGQTRPLDPSK